MKLVDPGPWSRLPPAPAPAPAPFAHSRHRPVTFNPFLEDDESKDEEVERVYWFFTGLVSSSFSLDSSVFSLL